MKFPGKPAKPSEPKEPEQFIDFKFSHEFDEGCHIFSPEFKERVLQNYVCFHNGIDLVNYLECHWSKLQFNSEKEYEPYGDSCYVKNTLDMVIPKESKLFEDPNYQVKQRDYARKLLAYPAQMSEWLVKCAKWEEEKAEFEKKEKEKEIDRARKLLKDVGEL